MIDYSRRIDALSPGQLKLLKMRLEKEGIDLNIETGIKDAEDNKDIYASLNPVEKKDYYSLSSVQKRLFTLNRLEGAGTIYNVSWIRIIEGKLDKNRLEEMFKILVKRHESFRTSFESLEGEPVQRIHDNVEFEVEYYDAQGTAPGEKGNGGLHANIIKNFIRPFALSNAPLLRAGLVKLSNDSHILIYDMHHIMSDMTSKKILIDEFIRLYKGERLHELKVQYKDFCQWWNNERVKAAVKRQEKYWLQEFSGEIPVLNLPTDYPRPGNKRFEGASLSFTIDRKEAAVLRTLASQENTTLFAIVLSIYNVFLAKLGRQEDIIVGIPIVGRRHSDLDNVIGMFVNTLVLRNYPSGGITFVDFLNRVKQRTIDSFDNQDYPFEDLVNHVVKTRDTGRNPIFDVFFSFAYPNVKIDGVQQEDLQDDGASVSDLHLKVKPYAGESSLSMFDMYLFGLSAREEISLGIVYSTQLFKKETIERFAGYFKEIVSAIVANNKIKLEEIKISHDLGTAKSSLFQDDDSGFEF